MMESLSKNQNLNPIDGGQGTFPPPGFANEGQNNFEEFGGGMSSIGDENEDLVNVAGPGDKKQFDFAGDTFS